MAKIVVDEKFSHAITGVVEKVEICDATGKVLGWFFPETVHTGVQLEPTVSEEELDRRSRSNERWYTTAEVLAYLEGL